MGNCTRSLLLVFAIFVMVTVFILTVLGLYLLWEQGETEDEIEVRYVKTSTSSTTSTTIPPAE